MKAIDKDRQCRYGSASEFAADIERYLKSEPVLAGPPSAVYRMRKFVVRHKRPVAAAAAVVLALVAGIVTTAWQARVAGQSNRLKRRNSETAAQAAAAEGRQSAEHRRRAIGSGEAGRNRSGMRPCAEQRRADDEAAIATAVNDFLRNDVLAQAGRRFTSRARHQARSGPEGPHRTGPGRRAYRRQVRRPTSWWKRRSG